MLFKFILYNLLFQIIIAILIMVKIDILYFSSLIEYPMIGYYIITIGVNIPFYLIIKYEKKLLSNFKNIIKKNK